MDDSDFWQEMKQMIVRRASAFNLVDTLAFVTEVAERLEEDPVFGEFVLAEHVSQDSRRRQLRLHGYTELDEADGSISLVIGNWVDDPNAGTLLTSDVAQLRGFLENFASEALAGKLVDRLMPSSGAYDVADLLCNRKADLSCIRLHIFSNQSLSQRFKKEFRSHLSGIATETHIWDLQRLKALYASDREREMVEIRLADFGSEGIPCIEASVSDELQSYLCVIDGNILADLYERYGSRLLEGNVRSFLGMKGAVNKGIRRTIQDESPRFFAYNNGIAATAMSVQTSVVNGTSRISNIADLQIVNGGQTTASILRARKEDRLSLEGVTVPMKLTVVARSTANDLIPMIAQFANTQNKVAIADFFANHPFHRKMEEISRRLLVPARAGARVQGKWFYERSRGQYQNERLYLSKAKKDAFDLEYPPKQVINKTELGKYDSVLAGKPQWVSLGQQKNFLKFAGKFSTKSEKNEKSETEYWEEISPHYGEAYFQRIVAMAILWISGETVVSAAKGAWYQGDYRSQIVAYGWAHLFDSMRKDGFEFNLMRVWERQSADDMVMDAFRRSAIDAQAALLNPPPRKSNPGEWAKDEACWEGVASLELDVDGLTAEWALDLAETRVRRSQDRQQGLRDDGISLQTQVVALAEGGYWKTLCDWRHLEQHVHGRERALLEKASTVQGVLKIASEKDWKKLIEIRRLCEEVGFRP